MKKLLFFITVFFCLPLLCWAHYLTVCAIFRDEAPYLKEWIEFHQKQGVEHFYLYNNLSKDDYLSVLKPFIENGIVTFKEWPYEHGDENGWSRIQTDAYMDCVKYNRKKVFWCAFIDTDEFLFSPIGKLSEVLKEYEEFSGICVNWVLYGHSNVKKIPEGKKMLDCLLYRAPLTLWENTYVKTIAQMDRVVTAYNPHCFALNKGTSVTENKKMFCGMNTNRHSVKIFRINHYRSRDMHFYNTVKKPRSKYWNNRGRFSYENILNEVYDPILSGSS